MREFFTEQETAELVWELWKKARGLNCILTFTESSFLRFTTKEYGTKILNSTSCVTFLRQYSNDCDVIKENFYAPDAEKHLVNAPAGTGLIYVNEDDVFVPFRYELPK